MKEWAHEEAGLDPECGGRMLLCGSSLRRLEARPSFELESRGRGQEKMNQPLWRKASWRDGVN